MYVCTYTFCMYTESGKYSTGSKSLEEARLLRSMYPGSTSSEPRSAFAASRCAQSTCTHHLCTYTHIPPYGSNRHPEHLHKHRQYQVPHPAALSFLKHLILKPMPTKCTSPATHNVLPTPGEQPIPHSQTQSEGVPSDLW